MYYISEDFNNACNDYVRTWHTKCVINEGKSNEITIVNNTPTNCLGAIQWESSINADDVLAMGQTGMDKITIEITRLQEGYNLQHATFHPYVGIEVNGETVWCPLGIFYADDVTTDDNYFTTTVTAYDGMSLLSETFDETEIAITFPISARQLLIAIATRFGLTINATTYTILRSLEGYILRDAVGRILVVDSLRQTVGEVYEGSYRDYIGWIAGLQGCNAHFDRNGAIAFTYYDESVLTVNPSVIYMNGLTLNKGGTVTYTSFLSGTEENPVTPTRYSGNAISFMNPYITSADLDVLGDNMLPITYQPCELHYRGNPCLDVGDRITVNDAKGNTHNVFIMQRTLSMTGGLDDTIQCFGMTEEQATLDSSPTSRKIKQLYTSLQKAVKEASDYINNTSGVFEFIDNGDGTNGGFTILASDNSSLIKCTAGGIGVSLDGGKTFQNAITRNGINASIIRTGTLNADNVLIQQSGSISDISITNGTVAFSDASNKKQLELSQGGIQIYYDGVQQGYIGRSYSTHNYGVSVFLEKDADYFGISYRTTATGGYDSIFSIDTPSHSSGQGIRINSSYPFKNAITFQGATYLNDTVNFFSSAVQIWKSSSGSIWLTNHLQNTEGSLNIGTGGSRNTSFIELTKDARFYLHGNPIVYNEGTFGQLSFGSISNFIAGYDGGNYLQFYAGGAIVMTANMTELTMYQNLNMNSHSILNQSDIRLKENVSATPVTALDTIDRMRFVEYDWKEDGKHDDLGVIAQELAEVNPSMVVDTGEYLAVNTSKFIMYALKAIQELSAEVKRMKGEGA